MRLAVAPELIEDAREGQAAAIESLLQLLWPHLYRIARSVVNDDALAQDAAQETCAHIYVALPKLRSTGAFPAWVYRICTREASRIAKQHSAKAHVAVDVPAADVETRLDVLQALRFLPPPLRVVILLHYYAGLNSSEIGAVLRIPSGTVRFRLARARRELHAALQPHRHIATAEAPS